jgi:hypothetical protein
MHNEAFFVAALCVNDRCDCMSGRISHPRAQTANAEASRFTEYTFAHYGRRCVAEISAYPTAGANRRPAGLRYISDD